MRKPHLVFAALVAAVTALVIVAGGPMAGPAGREAVTTGALLGGIFQAAAFLALATLFPDRGAVVFGVGMLGRFLVVALAALVLVPVAGLTPAPTLFALVSVLFGTSLIEPVFLSAGTRTKA